MEGIETKQMVEVFVRQGKDRFMDSFDNPATEQEKQEAMAQLKDLPRFLPFFMLLSMPVPGVTESYVLLAVTLEKLSGSRVTLLPSNFRNVFRREKHSRKGSGVHITH